MATDNLPRGPRTVEEACALPEFTGSYWDPKAKIGLAPLAGDTIIAFVDKDGVAKQPVFVDGKWMKMEMSL